MRKALVSFLVTLALVVGSAPAANAAVTRVATSCGEFQTDMSVTICTDVRYKVRANGKRKTVAVLVRWYPYIAADPYGPVASNVRLTTSGKTIKLGKLQHKKWRYVGHRTSWSTRRGDVVRGTLNGFLWFDAKFVLYPYRR